MTEIREAQELDRITFRCGVCNTPGTIRSVSINRKILLLEGYCAQCGHRRQTIFDIRDIDAWLCSGPVQ